MHAAIHRLVECDAECVPLTLVPLPDGSDTFGNECERPELGEERG